MSATGLPPATASTGPPPDDRHLIRSALDDTLVVEAAAGTGKTTELVARIVLLIQTGRAAITDIVAVTFSEKAAGELKLRLREELETARVHTTRTAEEAARLDAAVLAFEEAHVSTIHGFCAELLRERPVDAGIDPSFQVLTETQAEQVFDEAFAGWMESALSQPGEGVKRSLRRQRPVSWWRDADEADGPIGRLRRAGADLLQWRDHPAPWKRPKWDRERTIDEVVQSVLDLATMTEAPISEHDILYRDTVSLRRTAREIARATTAIGGATRDYDGLEALLISLAHDRDLKNTRKGSGALYSKTRPRDAIVSARAGLVGALTMFRQIADADLVGLLHGELQTCLDRYAHRKRKTGTLDFLDLLILARNLVRDCQPVRDAFRRRFRFILVDEFQDTDPLQAELLLLLASDDDGRVRPGALFVVGDPKQSIYRFRRADIGMYQRIRDDLARQHARPVVMKQSFRSVPNIQRFVNAAFREVMRRADEALQPGYVELVRHRPPIEAQPSVVALPVSRPYGRYRIAKRNIEQTLPDQIGEFVRWLVTASGWQVGVTDGTTRAVRASDVCLLFRRFIAYQDDVTRPYVEALESRGVPHLLVGGKTFHEREEVDAFRSALSAIEWPEDELSVFATLRGPLFAVGDEELLEYHARMQDASQGHAFHPYHVLDDLPAHLAPVRDALATLRALHAGRNYRPVADTIGRLIQTTRAHAGFMLWRGGEQVLANVLYISELARQYESEGGLSFRGFVETLRQAADRAQAPEAPILEEGSEGVRLMTVHKAKGLEFPVVILADITCGLSREEAQRHVDPSRGLAAVKLAGWAPLDLIEHNDLEACRDEAEGVRLAYVAATRARDLLVVPAIGDGPFDEGWVRPLNGALYPPLGDRQSPRGAAGVPEFKGKDTVLERPDGDLPGFGTVRPGAYELVDAGSGDAYSVVWWDPLLLDQRGDDTRGLRRDDLIAKDARPEDVDTDRARHRAWQVRLEETRARAERPTLTVMTATEWARVPGAIGARGAMGATGAVPTRRGNPSGLPYRAAASGASGAKDEARSDTEVTVDELPHAGSRPAGRRFGVLVHALLAAAPLDASEAQMRDLAAVQARVLGAPNDERDAAAGVVAQALTHPLLQAARDAAAAGRACRREAPISIVRDGLLIDGQIDLAFDTGHGWTVVDFKTDAELGESEDAYRRQVALYADALAHITGRPARATLLRL